MLIKYDIPTRIQVYPAYCPRTPGGQIRKSETAKLDKALHEAQTEEIAWKNVPLSGPTIDKEFSTNVSSQIGKTVVLNCRIKYGGGKTVSMGRGWLWC